MSARRLTVLAGAAPHDGPLAKAPEQRTAWMSAAACREYPVEMFFPPRGATPRLALAVCAGCPVLTECRAWCLTGAFDAEGIYVGVCGGMTASARRAAVRLRRKEGR